MPIQILMPALSPTMEEGTLAKWLVKEGDVIRSGDVIAEIETDKATMEIEAVEEGTLAKIFVGEGTENVAINTPIAVIAADGEDVGAAAAQAPEAAPAAAQPEPPAAPAEPAAVAPAAPVIEAPVAADPEIPAGTEMVATTVREALRDAMAEEMRRDELVFLMGEEVAEYQPAPSRL